LDVHYVDGATNELSLITQNLYITTPLLVNELFASLLIEWCDRYSNRKHTSDCRVNYAIGRSMQINLVRKISRQYL